MGLVHTDPSGWGMSTPVLLTLLGLSLGLVAALPSQDSDGGKTWVVIVAGSNGWYNYRHQVSGTTRPVQAVTLQLSVVILTDRFCPRAPLD